MLSRSLLGTSTTPLLPTLVVLNGVAVSTLYWAQALTGLAVQEFGPSSWTSLMSGATLAGYAVGVALLACIARDLTGANGLGLHALLLGVGLCAAAVAPGPAFLVLACFVAGIGCALTQRVLACTTNAVAPDRRGPVIGCVIASGLIGIVAARAVVPAASSALGWRTMFVLGAVVISMLGLAAATAALRVERRDWGVGPGRLPSAWRLWRDHPVVRRAALQQAFVFAMFNGGWVLFPCVLAQAGIAGAVPMGVVASIGAGAALVAGWYCRREQPAAVASVGLATVLLAVLAAGGAGGAGPLTYVAMVMLDVGTQTALVANQARAQACATTPAMRGRIAAIVTTVGFGAGAAGAALSNLLF